MQLKDLRVRPVVAALASLLALPTAAYAVTVANPICPDNTAQFNPDTGQDIVVPPGFKVSVFASNLNFPTGIAFRGNAQHFEVYVLESGHGLPSKCNEQSSFGTGEFDPTNPFTPDILVFDETGTKIRGPLAKPTAPMLACSPRDRPSTSALSTASREERSSLPTPIRRLTAVARTAVRES